MENENTRTYLKDMTTHTYTYVYICIQMNYTHRACIYTANYHSRKTTYPKSRMTEPSPWLHVSGFVFLCMKALAFSFDQLQA